MPSAAAIESCIIAKLAAAQADLGGMAVHGLTTGTLLQMEQALGGAGGAIAVLPKSSGAQNLNHGKPSAGAVWEVVITMNPNTPPMHIMDAAQAAQAALFNAAPVDASGRRLAGEAFKLGDVEYHIQETAAKTMIHTARFPVSIQFSRN